MFDPKNPRPRRGQPSAGVALTGGPMRRVILVRVPVVGQFVTDMLSLGPNIPIQGFIIENYSPFYVYSLYGKRIPALEQGWDHRTGPYLKEAEEMHSDYLGIRVDTAPDGTTATDQGNDYIRITLSTEQVQPVSQSLLSPVQQSTSVQITNFNNADNADGLVPTANIVVPRTIAEQWLYNPATPGFERARTAVIYKRFSGITATGQTAIWTPAAGKRFRLMGFFISLTQNAIAAAAAVDTVFLQDSSTDTGIGVQWFIPTAAGTVDKMPWLVGDIPGNGFLSATANNVLNFNNGVALTAGSFFGHVYGTEE